jgi:hypothetical protein
MKIIKTAKLNCNPTITEIWIDSETSLIIGVKLGEVDFPIDSTLYPKTLDDFTIEGCEPFCVWFQSLYDKIQ